MLWKRGVFLLQIQVMRLTIVRNCRDSTRAALSSMKFKNVYCREPSQWDFYFYLFIWHKLKIQLQRELKIQPTQSKQRNPSGNQEIMLIWGLSSQVTTKLFRGHNKGRFTLGIKGMKSWGQLNQYLSSFEARAGVEVTFNLPALDGVTRCWTGLHGNYSYQN